MLLRFGLAFIDHCRISKGLSEHTLKAYRQDKGEFELFCAAKYLAREDLKKLIVDYLEYLKERRNLKPRTVKRRMTYLKTFFKWLERNEMIASSPFHKLDISIRLPKQLPRALSLSEMQRLERHARPGPAGSFNPLHDLTAVPDDPADPKMTTYLAILLMAATGIRVGELVSLRLADIDLASGALRISGKGNRERTVFLTNQFLLLLFERYCASRKAVSAAGDAMFLNRSRQALTAQALRLRIKKISEQADLAHKVTPHMLRHTAATSLIEAGVDIRYVQKLLGHQSISTTELYTHVSDQSLKKVLIEADTIGRLEP